MSSRSETTRRRILDAAWARFAAGDAAHLEDVASDAGVSRQAVYLHFGSRSGLLLAVVDHMDTELGLYARIAAISALRSPREELEATLGLTAEYAPRIHPVAIALQRLAVTDADAREAFESRMAQRRAGLREIVLALERRGELTAGWSVEEVVDVLWVAGAPQSWEHLVVERGWAPSRFGSWLLHLAGSFLRP